MKKENKAFYQTNPYKVNSIDGKKFVAVDTVRTDTMNVSDGNGKTGKHVACINFPIFYTCRHNCECYKSGKCYACGGCYNFASNQATYSENLAFIRNNPFEIVVAAIVNGIREKGFTLSRYFTCGDIPNGMFFDVMVEVARRMDGVTFWAYTKKYGIVNSWCDAHGVDAMPHNLTIIFSHWRNDDGTYYPMDNPYRFPTSEFIPVGCEHLVDGVTHVCPCSDPSVVATCETCEHPCYKLQHGESMALLEHSTAASKERDDAVRAAHEALKKARKTRKGGKAA